jgi:hypothetical protein
MIILIAYIIIAFLAIIPGRIAQRKGRRFWVWWLFGVVILVPTLIASLVVSHKQPGVARGAETPQGSERERYQGDWNKALMESEMRRKRRQ